MVGVERTRTAVEERSLRVQVVAEQTRTAVENIPGVGQEGRLVTDHMKEDMLLIRKDIERRIKSRAKRCL